MNRNVKTKMMLRMILLLAIATHTLSATASTKSFMKVLKKNPVEYVTESGDYQKVMASLLAKGWTLGSKSLQVHHKADSNAEMRPDFSEVEIRTITDAGMLQPENIGLDVGSYDSLIFAGPYVVGKGEHRYAFVITVDDRTWGYSRDRYYVLFKQLSQVGVTGALTEVEYISYGQASAIKENAAFPLPAGYAALTADLKSMLTALSNKKWLRANTIDLKSMWSDRIYSSTWREELKFEFWNDFSRINYTSGVYVPNGSHTSGPFSELPKIRAIGARTVAPGVHEFIVMAGNTWAMYQKDNFMGFVRGNPELFQAKNQKEIESAQSRMVSYAYCYAGFDCAAQIKQRTWPANDSLSLDAGSITLRYDESKPDSLTIQYGMTHPVLEGATTEYRAE